MRWKIFENGDLINTIEADEEFCVTYCEEMGYTYELIPEQEDTPPDPWKAPQDYEPGQYLTIEGTMYRVLLPIYAGSQITPGTNVEATTIEAELARKEN